MNHQLLLNNQRGLNRNGDISQTRVTILRTWDPSLKDKLVQEIIPNHSKSSGVSGGTNRAVAVAVTLQTRIRKVFGSNLGQDIGYPN
jgi:hypothetical protein